MKNYVNGDGIPLGFGMALAQNPPAMEKFAAMTKAQQQNILSKVSQIQSKDEMRSYVASLDGETNPPASM